MHRTITGRTLSSDEAREKIRQFLAEAEIDGSEDFKQRCRGFFGDCCIIIFVWEKNVKTVWLDYRHLSGARVYLFVVYNKLITTTSFQ